MRTRGTREAHKEKWRKMKKNLLVSHWEWLPKAGWHLKAGYSFGILLFSVPFFFIFLLFFVSLSCASRTHDEKDTFFTHFRVFSIVFDHANMSASMHLLVKIHNKNVCQLMRTRPGRKQGFSTRPALWYLSSATPLPPPTSFFTKVLKILTTNIPFMMKRTLFLTLELTSTWPFFVAEMSVTKWEKSTDSISMCDLCRFPEIECSK